MGRLTSTWFRKVEKKTLETTPGKPFPLGATPTPIGVNFAVFAGCATAVTLILKMPGEKYPCREIPLDPRQNRTGDVWHVHVAGEQEFQYRYRVDGPQNGHSKYDPHKMLLDPCARAFSDGGLWGSPDRESWYSSVVRSFSNLEPLLLTPIQDTVVYEMHVRGFTRHKSSRVKRPGTFRGIVEKIPYLRELGITAVELLPVCEFDETDNENRDPVTGEPLKNFWGYSTLGFFSPKASYAGSDAKQGPIVEFREMVRALHRAGIEVILDMVFNHTGEGDLKGHTVNFRGLANSVYYLLDEKGRYRNFSGCGNSVNCNHPVVRDFILDCLRYWVVEMGVDGFRFDLASSLTRGRNGEPLADPPLIERIAADPVLSHVKLIAEPWDAGGLYQVGSFPAHGRWGEWNDKFRDDVRSFLKGDNDKAYAMALRLIGSPDVYAGRSPCHSLNFVTSHDGFTLCDLVSYNSKHNERNGERNRDGSDNNRSWNCGVEGPCDDPVILSIRRRQMKNFLAVLFLAHGVPMLVAGDEFARTQQGNNNPYCQDNEISWIDWSCIRHNAEILRFTREMIAFRKRHPVLRREKFRSEESGHQGVQWHGTKIDRPDWGYHSHSLALLLEGKADGDDDIYLAINAYWKPLVFEIPPAPSGRLWHLLADTSQPSPQDIVPETRQPRKWGQKNYEIPSRSLVVLVSMK